MDATQRSLRLRTIEAQLELCELVCRSLASEYANENLTDAQKAAIVDRWSETTSKRHELRLLLEAQERNESVDEAGELAFEKAEAKHLAKEII